MNPPESSDRFARARGVAVMAGAAAAGLTAWLGLIGRLPRQPWVGIRLPSTLRSDETWRAAHVAGGPPIVGGALVAFALGAVMVFRRLDRTTALILRRSGSAALVVGALVGAVRGSRAARRIT